MRNMLIYSQCMSAICERKAPVARYKITDAVTYRNTLATKANKRFHTAHGMETGPIYAYSQLWTFGFFWKFPK